MHREVSSVGTVGEQIRRRTSKMGGCSKTLPSENKDSFNLSHHVSINHGFRLNLSLTVQGKQQRWRARTRGRKNRATLHAGPWFAKHSSQRYKNGWAEWNNSLLSYPSYLYSLSGFLIYTAVSEHALTSLFWFWFASCLHDFLLVQILLA